MLRSLSLPSCLHTVPITVNQDWTLFTTPALSTVDYIGLIVALDADRDILTPLGLRRRKTRSYRIYICCLNDLYDLDRDLSPRCARRDN